MAQVGEVAPPFGMRARNVPEPLARIAEIKWEEAKALEERSAQAKISDSCQDAISRGLGNSSLRLADEMSVRRACAVNTMRAYAEAFVPLFFEFDRGKLDDARDAALRSAQTVVAGIEAKLEREQQEIGLKMPGFTNRLKTELPELMIREFDKVHCALIERERQEERAAKLAARKAWTERLIGFLLGLAAALISWLASRLVGGA